VRGKAKVLIGLAKGKKFYDKRETIKEKESKREVERVVKERNR
jgi:SsrA-binding protein